MVAQRIQAFLLALVTATAVWGMDTPKPEPEKPKDPALEQARAAIDKQDWAGAQGILRDAVARNPQSADLHNLYAYSIRKGTNPQMDLVFRHYNEALRLDPKHRGAHEYIGEAYLMSGNVAKAKEHLAQLDRLCTFGCNEYSKLKAAVAQYEQQHAKK
jgi:cytochrome c-type biogenesis protein CcmH/NrfG